MCYTKQASITAFLTGLISSILLILFGNKENKSENLVIGILFLLVSFMQLFDYLIYIDPNCENGLNKLAGYIGPIFNAIQPVILYIFILNMSDNKYTKTIASIINIPYIIYISILYIQYLQQNKLCTSFEEGRPSWTWYHHGFGDVWNKIYLIVITLNVLMFFRYKYIMIAALLGLLFFIISVFNYKYHIGEFWCFFVNTIPLIILLIQKSKI
jgi:hypothetical protein